MVNTCLSAGTAGTALPQWPTTTSAHLPTRNGGSPRWAGRCRPCHAHASIDTRPSDLLSSAIAEFAYQGLLAVNLAVTCSFCQAGALPTGSGACVLVCHSEAYLWEGAHHVTRRSVCPAAVSAQPMGNGTCVLVGDDEAFLREAAAIAAQELGCKIFAGRLKYEMESHNQQKFDQLPLADRCTATMHLLTDLELLAHTDYFVGEAPVCPSSPVRMQYNPWLCNQKWANQAVPLLARNARLPHQSPVHFVGCEPQHLSATLQLNLLSSGGMRLRACPGPPATHSLMPTSHAGSFNSGLAHLVDKLRYVLYGKHRRTTIDASISAAPSLPHMKPCRHVL